LPKRRTFCLQNENKNTQANDKLKLQIFWSEDLIAGDWEQVSAFAKKVAGNSGGTAAFFPVFSAAMSKLKIKLIRGFKRH